MSAPRNGAGWSIEAARRCSSTRSTRATFWRMCQTKGRADPGLGEARRSASSRDGRAPRSSGSTRPGRHERGAPEEGPPRRSRTSSGARTCRSRSWTSAEATRFTLRGAPATARNTISVTGNVPCATTLHRPVPDSRAWHEREDALDSAAHDGGGPVSRTGAGGSAPKHVQQLLKENHLRWDSLGEFPCARGVARDARREDSQRGRRRSSRRPSDPRDRAGARERPPRRRAKVGELDNRGSHFYLAPVLGRRSWPARTDDTNARRPLRGGGGQARRLPGTRSRTRCSWSKASRSTLGGYYRPRPGMRRRKSCDQARRSRPPLAVLRA